eukprot:5772039-Pleurochrysis_carterae.AAC.1
MYAGGIDLRFTPAAATAAPAVRLVGSCTTASEARGMTVVHGVRRSTVSSREDRGSSHVFTRAGACACAETSG